MEQLSKKLISDQAIVNTFSLPEKVIQFGTGVLLRGLPDYFIDKANKKGVFNGRIVVVKSTDGRDGEAFADQDALYTICVRGIENETVIKEDIICSAISRVLTAKTEWTKILDCAKQKSFEVVISNTTEVGIQLVREFIDQSPPQSYPAKLLAFLFERFKHFKGDPAAGLVILPTELLTENGEKLKAILTELMAYNKLDDAFKAWVLTCNKFCNTLVDCIVPGKPSNTSIETAYHDELLIISEVYRLWAIEGDEEVKKVLGFHLTDNRVKIEPDITRYRELKLRLLNGTHTLSSGMAVLAHVETVRQGMDDAIISGYVRNLMLKEIATAIPYAMDPTEVNDFAESVLDRFRNPAIHHPWVNITLQYTSKLAMRVVPVLLHYFEKNKSIPPLISFGFSAYLRFMKSEKTSDGKYVGTIDGQSYPITDSQAGYLHNSWKGSSESDLVKTILSDQKLWGEDLTRLDGFAEIVYEGLQNINRLGVKRSLESM